MSTHKVEVVRLGPVEKHPDADTLGIVKVWGYTAIVRLGEWNEGDLAAYIEPDYVVPNSPQFAFLSDKRIRAKRLRGVWSQGLLTKAPEGARDGDDVMEALGIVRYEPPARGRPWEPRQKGENLSAESAPDPLNRIPKYDLEPLRRYVSCFEPGEPVFVTEKIHGTNARYCWRDGRMWAGARSHWRKRPEDGSSDWWWSALDQNPWIEDLCRENPDMVVFGEIFGDVQDLKYGAKHGQYLFRVFDVMMLGDLQFITPMQLTLLVPKQHRVPDLACGVPFDLAKLEELSRADSVLAKHVSEGIVVKPQVERWDRRVGRVALKLVSDRYLERSR